MDRISPSTARARLRRVRLSQPDHEALGVLLEELGEQVEVPVERAQQVLFAGRTPAAATKAVERLVKLVNTAAAEDSVDLRLEVRGAKKLGARGRLLGFSADRVEPAGDPLREHEAVRGALIEDRQATLLGPRKIVLCHAPRDARLAGQLWDLLTQALDCDQSRFAVWRPDRDVLAGDDADQQFREAVADAELAIVALSNSWLGQPKLGEVLRRGQIEDTRLLVVPVALRELTPHAVAHGFGTTSYPQGPHSKPFADLRGDPAQDTWVNGLVDQVHRLLDRSSGAVRATRSVSSPDMGLRDRRALSAEGGDGYYGLHGRPEGMQPDLRPDTQPDSRPVNVVSHLLAWACNPDGTPLAALLGEYGAGKTITCQELTERLRRKRVGDQPEALYFDLRGVGNLDRGVPALADILTECIDRGWASADGPLPSGAEVIAQARERPTLFVLDGLDEVLVRLDAAQGVTFTHELLKLRPIRTRQGIRAPFAGEHTKVLLSCRTHYFRSLREQSRHFLEQDRDLTTAEDYTTLVLLPLTEEQIQDYLGKALPGRDTTQVMDMLRAVHDLSDLATRPYTLAKVATQIPFIERRHAEQRPVHAATIYQQVLRDWLARDQGKHRLRPDHKLTLMARLAAWSWQRGSRRVDSTDLDDWLDEQLATDPVLRRRYRERSRDQLEEDLRTATFVIRSDDNGPDRPDFQFAHSSIHEYFLAQYLCDALRDGRRQDWCVPMPSTETLDFLGQLITDDDDPPALTAELGRWRAPYTAQASELRLRYALRARDHGWPHPTLAGSDLTGATLRGWRFTGTDTDPLNLSAATLTGADLRDTRWDHVTLTQATLRGARLDRATLHHTNLTASTLRDANLSGAFLHHCRLDSADLTGITTHQLRHIGSGTTLPTPAHPTSTHLHALTGHTDGVLGVAFSPEGTRLATTSTDGTARLWDSTTGESLLTLTGHTGTVWGVAFSPDGTRLATTSADGTARLWDSTTGESLLTLTGHTSGVGGVAFSPDGTRLATTSADGTARLWDSTTGESLLTLTSHTSRLWRVAFIGVAFSPDGTRLATTSDDDTARLWDTTTGESLLTLTGHTDRVRGVAFSPDGTRLATTSDDDTARLWDTTTGESLLTLTGHTDGVWGVAFSPDGTRLATTSADGTARLWDTTTGESLLTLTGHTHWVRGVAFSPDGTRLATTSADGTARLWDTTTGESLLTLTGHTSGMWGVAFSPDGTRLATTSADRTARLWDPTTGESLLTLTGHTSGVWGVAFSPDGTRLATASTDGTARLWDPTTGESLLTLTGHTDEVWGVAFSPDGTRLATTSADQTARLWDSTTGESLLTLTSHTSRLWRVAFIGVAFSPDGTRLATTSDDQTARLWDSTTGESLLTLTGHTSGMWGVAFSPDGTRLATTNTDGTARLWDPTTGESLLTLTGHTSGVWGVAFSPDGTCLATTSTDGTARLWDPTTGESLLTLTGHTDRVWGVAFSPDGTRLATTSDDQTARLWDTTTGQLIWLAASFPNNAAASWSPTSNRLLSTTGDAWRYLRAACFDDDGRLLSLQPHARYYTPPQPGTEP